jgi:hypothetical protein
MQLNLQKYNEKWIFAKFFEIGSWFLGNAFLESCLTLKGISEWFQFFNFSKVLT